MSLEGSSSLEWIDWRSGWQVVSHSWPQIGLGQVWTALGLALRGELPEVRRLSGGLGPDGWPEWLPTLEHSGAVHALSIHLTEGGQPPAMCSPFELPDISSNRTHCPASWAQLSASRHKAIPIYNAIGFTKKTPSATSLPFNVPAFLVVTSAPIEYPEWADSAWSQ